MARKSIMELTVKDVIASGNQAAVWFENRTPKGVVESCDWVRVEADRPWRVGEHLPLCNSNRSLSAARETNGDCDE
jgi:hypothetical protein